MAATRKPSVVNIAKIRKHRKLRVRLDARDIEERVSPHYFARTKARKAFTPDAQLAANGLTELMIFLENLVKSRGPLFDIARRPDTLEPFLCEKQLGTPFQQCIQLKLEKLKAELPDHVFHPALGIFHQCQVQFPYREAIIQPEISKQNPIEYAAAANRAAEWLRWTLSSKNYQQQTNAFAQASNRNYRALMTYIELLFTKAPTLWVIRLDLGYASPLDDYDAVKQDREKFLRNLRKSSPVGEPFGYAWKLERPTNRSWRYHFLFFFKPQKGQDPAGIAVGLGNYWNATITKGQGAFLNCNTLPPTAPRRRGTGIVGRDDFTAPDSRLEQAVWYMTQLDYYIKLRPDKKWKTFFGGNKTTASEREPAAPKRPPKATFSDRLRQLKRQQPMPRYREEIDEPGTRS